MEENFFKTSYIYIFFFNLSLVEQKFTSAFPPEEIGLKDALIVSMSGFNVVSNFKSFEDSRNITTIFVKCKPYTHPREIFAILRVF